jgi:hypothetical protein
MSLACWIKKIWGTDGVFMNFLSLKGQYNLSGIKDPPILRLILPRGHNTKFYT